MLRIDPWNILFTVLNLLILFGAMMIFFFKPIKKILEQRQAEADAQFDDAKNRQNEADELKADYEEKLKAMEAEKERTMAEAKASAKEEYQRIVGDAEQVAAQMKTDAKAEAEEERSQILKKAEKDIADLVVEAAEKVVGEKSGEAADKSLYDDFLHKAGDK